MKRGLRNNNPLNIRHSADKWQGERAEQTDKEFVQFQSMAYGYRAAWKVLDSYYLRFKRSRKAYNVRNIISRWAPPTENDTEAYLRAVVKLSGLGGNENMGRPRRTRKLYMLRTTSRLIAAMTCVENGIGMEQVDWEAIWEGYRLAFPDAFHAQDDTTTLAMLNEVKNLNEPSGCTLILRDALDDMNGGVPLDDMKIWDEYWDWSPQAYAG